MGNVLPFVRPEEPAEQRPLSRDLGPEWFQKAVAAGMFERSNYQLIGVELGQSHYVRGGVPDE